MKSFLFLGDSITDANHLFSENPLGDGFVSLLGKLRPNDQLCNRGHDGFTVEQLWRMIQRDGIFQNTSFMYTNQTTPKDWDVITILIGVNDIPVEVYTNRNRIPYEYEEYYRKILEYIDTHSSAKLVFIEPFLFQQPAIYKSWQGYLQIESQIVQNLAHEYHAHFLPANQVLQEACTQWGISAITLDGIHLTELGNQLLANLWIAALGDVL